MTRRLVPPIGHHGSVAANWVAANLLVLLVTLVLTWTGPLVYLVRRDATGLTVAILLYGALVVLGTLPRVLYLDRLRAILRRDGPRAAVAAIIDRTRQRAARDTLRRLFRPIEPDPTEDTGIWIIERHLHGPHRVLEHLGNAATAFGFLGTLIGAIRGLDSLASLSREAGASLAEASVRAGIVEALVGWFSTALHTSVAGLVVLLWILLITTILDEGAEGILLEIASEDDAAPTEAREG